jgi:hypothetical protein
MNTTLTTPAVAGKAKVSPAQPPLKNARVANWAIEHYHNFLLARAKMPFAWGTNDCAMFCADGIQTMIGVDIAADFRGQYTDQASALAAIKAIAGGATIADAAAWCASKHGLVEWEHPRMAKRGDLVIALDGEAGPLAALVHLNGADVVAPGDAGLRRLPITAVVRSWHVGPVEHARTFWSQHNV